MYAIIDTANSAMRHSAAEKPICDQNRAIARCAGLTTVSDSIAISFRSERRARCARITAALMIAAMCAAGQTRKIFFFLFFTVSMCI